MQVLVSKKGDGATESWEDLFGVYFFVYIIDTLLTTENRLWYDCNLICDKNAKFSLSCDLYRSWKIYIDV